MGRRSPVIQGGDIRYRPRTTVVIASFIAMILPLMAAAQTPPPPAPEGPQAQARTAYSAGVLAFQRSDYETARQQFAAADEAFSSPNIRLMLGRALVQLGRLREAHAVLTSALEAARGAQKYEATARAANDELHELNKNVAIVNLRVEDPTGRATLTVGQHEIARDAWEEPIITEPGSIRITLTGPDGQTDVKELEMTGGSAATLAMLVPDKPAEQPAPEPAVLAPTAVAEYAPVPEQSSSRSLQSVSYVAAGVGAAGLVAFGVLGAMSNHEYTELDKACSGRAVCGAQFKDNATRGHTYQTIANVSLAVGVGAIATGLVLWVVGLPGERAHVALTPTGARVSGSF
jgi:tetratricopeptide (TPR) repeat protein